MLAIEQMILEWLETHGQYAIYLVPLFAFAEACIGIGLLVPSLILVVVSTTVFTNQLAGIESIVILAFFGALLADQLGFYVGRWLGPSFHHSRLATRHRARLDKAEAMIRKYGSAAIFIGRFIPAIRSLIPAMLGLSGFERVRYLILDILACALWAVALGAIVQGLDAGFFAT
ncbi:MAG: DedA family protein [Gammaproteobacteria bacterium]|nr:DedA family protein [Gammaproteobacteria bacterium]